MPDPQTLEAEPQVEDAQDIPVSTEAASLLNLVCTVVYFVHTTHPQAVHTTQHLNATIHSTQS